jgi:hypothetical protein
VTDEIDAKLARIAERLHTGAEQRRRELSAIGFLEPADALKAAFGVSKFYLRTPRLTFGDPVFNGCDLTQPGVVGWTECIPPKAKIQNDAGPRGARSAPTSKGRNRREEGSEGGLLGGSE